MAGHTGFALNRENVLTGQALAETQPIKDRRLIALHHACERRLSASAPHRFGKGRSQALFDSHDCRATVTAVTGSSANALS